MADSFRSRGRQTAQGDEGLCSTQTMGQNLHLIAGFSHYNIAFRRLKNNLTDHCRYVEHSNGFRVEVPECFLFSRIVLEPIFEHQHLLLVSVFKMIVIEGRIVLPRVDRTSLAANPNVVAHVEELLRDRGLVLICCVCEPAPTVLRSRVHEEDGAERPLVRDPRASAIAQEPEETDHIIAVLYCFVGCRCSVEPPSVIAGVLFDSFLHLLEVEAVEATLCGARCVGQGAQGGSNADSSLECSHSLRIDFWWGGNAMFTLYFIVNNLQIFACLNSPSEN